MLRNKGVKYSTKKVEHGHMGIAHQNEILRFTATEEIQQNGQNVEHEKSSDLAQDN